MIDLNYRQPLSRVTWRGVTTTVWQLSGNQRLVRQCSDEAECWISAQYGRRSPERYRTAEEALAWVGVLDRVIELAEVTG